jgi:hypothetical protein
MTLEFLRWIASILLIATGLIDIPYGWFYVAGYASYVWYAMGVGYVVTAGVLVLNLKPRFFQVWALAYTLFLLSAWATGGSRDIVAIADKAVEVALVVTLAYLVRFTWSSKTVALRVGNLGK